MYATLIIIRRCDKNYSTVSQAFGYKLIGYCIILDEEMEFEQQQVSKKPLQVNVVKNIKTTGEARSCCTLA